LNAVNNYQGNTTIGVAAASYWANVAANPTLALGIDDALPYGGSAGNVVFGTSANANTATLNLNGHNAHINGLTGSANATVDNTVAGSYTLTVGNNDQSSAFGGVVKNTTGTLALTKVGAGTLTLNGANTYTGNTTISAGTLALGSSGSINSSATIGIAAGATFDVSAISAYTLSSSTTLSATDTATIAGNASGTVSLGTNNITLAYDGANPALTLSQGALQLNGNAFTVNGAALASGTYTIVQQASGSITSSGIYPTVTGTAIDSSHIGLISVSGGNVILTVQLIPTTLALISSSPINGYLASVTFTAAVHTNGVTAGLAGGTVQFKINGVAFGLPVGLTAGVASTNLATLPRGTNFVVAEYSGDASYLPSTNSLSQIVTNHPPVVANVSYYRGAVAAYKITISDLLTNAFDADSDPLAVSFGTSTNGISLTVAGDLALYSNTNLVNDQLSYTVSDAFGGSTTASVTITASPFLAGLSATVAVSGSTATVSFAGIPGYHYGVQRSTNLVDYVTILTTNAPAGGLFNYTDDFTDLGGPPSSAYYRLLWNP
jgi:autotransporter-associated beta strand protein